MSEKTFTAVDKINHSAIELKKLALKLCKLGRENGHDTSAIDQINMELQILLKDIQEAKALEKQQIIDAYKSDMHPCSDEDAEQYYNQTYKP